MVRAMDERSNENADLHRIIEHIDASRRIDDATTDVCDELIGHTESLIKNALDRAVQIGSYTPTNAQRLMDMFCEYTATLRSALSSKLRTDASFAAGAVRDLVGMALAIGESLPPDQVIRLAKAGFLSKQGGASGGIKSGESRRSKRAQTWEPHARELAVKIRDACKHWSQDEVAADIIFQWKDDKIDPPGHKTLKNLVSQMEAAGELPRRKT